MSAVTERGEDRLIDWLRRQPGTDLIGDDAALLAGACETTVATVDSQIAGVHVPDELDAGLLARRLLHVNLSDLAAMGAPPPGLDESSHLAELATSADPSDPDASIVADVPTAETWCHALVTIAAPEFFDFRHFFSILLAESAPVGVSLAGGDLASSPTLTVTMTLIGRRQSDWKPIRRAGALPGDRLWVGGTLGESGAGLRLLRRGARLTAHGERAHVFLPGEVRGDANLAEAARSAVRRHLRPSAQLELGAWLGERARSERIAALDLSDGLGKDLPRLARESGVGAEIDSGAVPMAEGFHALCEILGQDPLDLVLGGGEDYVLLFTLPPGVEPPERFGCRPIGEIKEGDELVLLRNGHREAWPRVGWDHLERV